MEINDQAEPKPLPRTLERDEVLRRVGRNLVCFQQVESMLKSLNAHIAVTAPRSKLATTIEGQVAAGHKDMMGAAAGKLRQGLLASRAPTQPPDQVDEPWLGIVMSVDLEAGLLEQYDRDMKALIDSRNDLVHHFLPRWHAAVDGNADDSLRYLDAQREETIRMLTRLRGWALGMDSTLQHFGAFFASKEGKQAMLLASLQGSRLVALMGEIAARIATPDGWVLLAAASNLARREEPSELENLSARFGRRKLSEVLALSELFDLGDQPTSGGGRRRVYRPNLRYASVTGRAV